MKVLLFYANTLPTSMGAPVFTSNICPPNWRNSWTSKCAALATRTPPATVSGSRVTRSAKGSFAQVDAKLSGALDTFEANLATLGARVDADVVHVHTWYAHLSGILAKLLYGIPLVHTVHSLEPLRPWKREQLGGGYDTSSWIERTSLGMADAVIAVSQGTKQDILDHFDIDPAKISVIYNGINVDQYRRTTETSALEKYGSIRASRSSCSSAG